MYISGHTLLETLGYYSKIHSSYSEYITRHITCCGVRREGNKFKEVYARQTSFCRKGIQYFET
jgi:hypothetical protein